MSGRRLYTANPQAAYRSAKAEIDAAIQRVLEGETHILGPHVANFEARFAQFFGTSHGVGVGSGTDALEIALSAAGIGPSDEVITVGHTAIATLAAIRRTGASPVVVDVEPDFYTIDVDRVAEALTPKVKAIVPVHIYGQPANMSALMKLVSSTGIFVLEDCAQAHGATAAGKPVGSLGHAAAFSFYPTKNLGAVGDAGAIFTSDDSIAEKARALRQYGWRQPQFSESFGWVSRLDELQASILLAKLNDFPAKIERRRRIAARYNEAFKDLPVKIPFVRPGCEHAYHLYVLQTDRRDELRAHLASKEIYAGIHYPFLAQQQPAWQDIEIRGSAGVSERLVRRILSIPLFPEMTQDDVEKVIEATCSFFHGGPRRS